MPGISAWALLAAAGAAAATTAPFKLGLYGPMTSVDMSFAAAAVAADLDFAKNYDPSLVTRFGPPIVTVANLNTSLRLELQIGNSASSTNVGVKSALGMFQGLFGYDTVQGLVGGYHSGISGPVANVIHLFEGVQVAWGSTSPALSNDALYPFFSRTMAPDSIQGKCAWQTLRAFGVAKVAVWYQQDSYGSGLFQVVKSEATAANQPDRVAGVPYPYRIGADYDADLAKTSAQNLAQAQAKVVFLIATRALSATMSANFIEYPNLVQAQVIGSEAATGTMAELAPIVRPGYSWFFPQNKGRLWPQFTDMWKLMTSNDVTAASAQTKYKIDVWDVPVASATNPLSPSVFAAPESVAGELPFLFDAVYVFIVAANELMNQGVPVAEIKGQRLLSAVRSVGFEGISGHVSFDAVGDRAAAYELFNMKPSVETVAVWTAAAGLQPLSGFEMLWMSGERSWTLPPFYSDCDAGFAKDASQLCAQCPAGFISLGGAAESCDPCPLGTSTGGMLGASQCVACEPGQYAPDTGTQVCRPCPAGFISVNMSAEVCDPCPLGKSTAGLLGASQCVDCEPGRYGPESGTPACSNCPAGSYADGNKTVKCTSCEAGRYQAIEGATRCNDCYSGSGDSTYWTTLNRVTNRNGELQWVTMAGSSDPGDCACDVGSWPKEVENTTDNTTRRECVACGEGMDCKGANDVFIKAGYHSTSDAPDFVYRCYGNELRCVYGVPGHCADGRLNASVACMLCEPGLKAVGNGTCQACGAEDQAPLAGAIIGALVLMVVIYYVIDSTSPTSTTKSAMLIAITGSQLVTLFQHLAVFGAVSVEWPSPFKEALALVSLFTFKLDFLTLDCSMPMAPLVLFIGRVFLVVLFVVVMLLIHVLFVFALHRGNFVERRPSMTGSIGMMFSAFFISIVSSMLAPFMCSPHPNGMSTVNDYPTVRCFSDDPDHLPMILAGAVATLIPLSFLGAVCWVIHKLPVKFSSGDTEFLRSFRFLFFRFRPGKYWYVIVFLGRNLLMAVVPVLGDPGIQLIALGLIIVPTLCITLLSLPWLVQAANASDAGSTVMLTFLVMLFCLCVDAIDPQAVGTVCLVCFVGGLLVLFLAAAYGVFVKFCRSNKPYAYFLTHHKLGAGNFARLLKVVLGVRTKKKIFLDSDDLSDLKDLFGIVGSDVDVLLCICSKEILSRVWCVGEIVTAQNQTPIVRVLLPDFVPPDAAFLEKYMENVPDIANLTQYGISTELVQIAIRFLDTQPAITFGEQVTTVALNDFVTALGQARQGVPMQPVPSEKKTSDNKAKDLIVADTSNLESCSTAMVIMKLIAPLMEVPPTVVQEDMHVGAVAKTLCFVCSNGVFTNAVAVGMLVTAAEKHMSVLPVVSEPSFRFPTKDTLFQIAAGVEPVLAGASIACTGAAFAGIVAEVFKEIAVEVNPQDSETILFTRIRSVHARLGKVKPLAADIGELDVNTTAVMGPEFAVASFGARA